MDVDPNEACTFWYANEYYDSTSSAGWKTRIVSLKMPICQGELSQQNLAPVYSVILSKFKGRSSQSLAPVYYTITNKPAH
jgi:hypothetical protein